MKIDKFYYHPYELGFWGFNFSIYQEKYGDYRYFARIVISLGKWKKWDGYKVRDGVSHGYGLNFRWGTPLSVRESKKIFNYSVGIDTSGLRSLHQ